MGLSKKFIKKKKCINVKLFKYFRTYKCAGLFHFCFNWLKKSIMFSNHPIFFLYVF